MALSKYKHEPVVKPRLFVNREESIKKLRDGFNKLLIDDNFFKVVVLYGIGGIGKSSLIRKFLSSREIHDQNKVLIKNISLEIYKNISIAEILLNIRKIINKKCLLFEFAFLKYWKLTRNEQFDDNAFAFIGNNTFFDILDVGLSFIGLNVSGIIKLINKSDAKLEMQLFTQKYGDYLKEINDFTEYNVAELLKRLPCYLGLGIEEMLESKNIKLLFCFDSYERCKQNILDDLSNEWLKELIASTNKGFFIISSREILNWDKLNPEWSPHMSQIPIEELSKKDSQKYLCEFIDNSVLIEKIYESTKGIPIYLDLCIDTYLSKIRLNQKIESKDFMFKNLSDVITAFYNHLTSNNQTVIKTLSIVGVFNYRIFNYLIKELNLSCTVLDYEDFCSKTIVNYLHTQGKMRKIHEAISDNIANALNETEKNVITMALLKYLKFYGQIELNDFELLYLLDHCFILVNSEFNIKHQFFPIETLIDILLYLYDKGWWVELNDIVDHISQVDDSLYELKLLILGLIKRRTQDIKTGIKLLKQIPKVNSGIGKHSFTVKTELAYLYSIFGLYDTAYNSFKEAYNTVDESMAHERFYSRVNIYYADILMLKGDFRKSLYILTDFSNKISKMETNYFETQRIIGHNYRFNLLFDKALEIYTNAIESSSESKAQVGKYLTNLCEIYSFKNPQEAIKIFDAALSVNQEIHSQIEIGKLYCSYGIANTMLNNYGIAEKSITKSYKIQEKIGYKAGLLFSLQAKGLLEYSCKGDVQEQTYSQMNRLVEKNQCL